MSSSEVAQKVEAEVQRVFLQNWLADTLKVEKNIEVSSGNPFRHGTDMVQDDVRFRVHPYVDYNETTRVSKCAYGVVMVHNCPSCNGEYTSKPLKNLLDVGKEMKSKTVHACPPPPLTESERKARPVSPPGGGWWSYSDRNIGEYWG
jgi:hypothetical protein